MTTDCCKFSFKFSIFEQIRGFFKLAAIAATLVVSSYFFSHMFLPYPKQTKIILSKTLYNEFLPKYEKINKLLVSILFGLERIKEKKKWEKPKKLKGLFFC